MSKDKYSEVSKYFGVEPVEEVIGVRRDKLLKSIVQQTITYAVWLTQTLAKQLFYFVRFMCCCFFFAYFFVLWLW